MVDYDIINEHLEKTRLEVRRIVMAEGAAAAESHIVTWLRKRAAGAYGVNDNRRGSIYETLADEIERGVHVSGERR